MTINFKWILYAIRFVIDGRLDNFEKSGVKVYRCGKIIRIDIKDNVEVIE